MTEICYICLSVFSKKSDNVYCGPLLAGETHKWLWWGKLGWLPDTHPDALSLLFNRTGEEKLLKKVCGLRDGETAYLTSDHHRQNELDLGEIIFIENELNQTFCSETKIKIKTSPHLFPTLFSQTQLHFSIPESSTFSPCRPDWHRG